MPFIAITEKAFARLVNEQYEVLQRGIAVHRRLEQLVLEQRGLDEVARALSAAIGGTVVMLDAHGETMAALDTSAASCRAGALDAIRAEAVARNGAGRPIAFEPAHDDVAGRALALPVAASRRAARRPGSWRPRRGRAGRVRAADPAAGGHGRGARADAPPRRARHRAPPGRRHPRGGVDGELTRTSCAAACGRSASARARRCSSSRSPTPATPRPRWSARWSTPAAPRWSPPAGGLLCAVVDGADERPGRARRRRPATALAARARDGAGGGQPAGAGRGCCAALPRGALRARGDRDARRHARPTSPSWRRPRRAPVPAVGAGRRGAAPVPRQRARADRERRGRVRRRAAALARGVHRAQRPVGARRARALLPPPHPALPDPADRAADRARPLERARPDRVLAGAAGAGAGRDERRSRCSEPAGRSPPRSSATWRSPRRSLRLLLLDIDGERAASGRQRARAGRGASLGRPTRAPASPPRSTTATCS